MGDTAQAAGTASLADPRWPPESIAAPRTDPVYSCHAYPTKVPIAAIAPFIEAFTRPGELVADPFAGSGMTGLAALALGRRARLSDISVLGRHIARGYLAAVPARELREHARAALGRARAALGPLYETARACDGQLCEAVRTVWSFSYRCPACASELVYFEHLDAQGRPPKSCPACTSEFSRRRWPRGEDVPVRVVVRDAHGRLQEQAVGELDRARQRDARADPRLAEVPSLPIEPSREMYGRSGLRKSGLTDTARFFAPRNAIALLELWRAIGALADPQARQKLRFAFTAILPRASRRYQWSPQRPLNAQNQTYYIAPVHYEWNVFELFERKVEAAIRASEAIFGASRAAVAASAVDYTLASAAALAHLPGESVDYVFTDPPFGGNIFYSDMSLFQEAWLGQVTDHGAEAVVHTTGARRSQADARYAELLRGAFAEAHRVLRPGRYLSVVFGSSSGRLWGLVQRALREAGFAVPVHVATLDKGQRSVKGLNSGSEAVLTLDLILTFAKSGARAAPAAEPDEPPPADIAALIQAAIGELAPDEPHSPSHVYMRVLRAAMQRQLALDGLHLCDVLSALREAGYRIDRASGALLAPGASPAPARSGRRRTPLAPQR
jgi:16S rRNA G966 N2-methylase RsmD